MLEVEHNWPTAYRNQRVARCTGSKMRMDAKLTIVCLLLEPGEGKGKGQNIMKQFVDYSTKFHPSFDEKLGVDLRSRGPLDNSTSRAGCPGVNVCHVIYEIRIMPRWMDEMDLSGPLLEMVEMTRPDVGQDNKVLPQASCRLVG